MSDLDEDRLAGWLAASLPALGGLISLEKLPGGQSNPTYRLATSGGDYVLRRKPFGQLLPSAHAIEREYRLIAALHPTGFPVPAPVALCEDAAVIGAPFYLMGLVAGRNLVDATLPQVPQGERRAFFNSMIDTLAELHRLDHEALGLSDFGRPGNYFARQVDRWTRQYRAAQTDDVPEVERLIAWLPGTVPEQQGASIIHGDYRMDNLIYAPDVPRVAAVIDWELATIGDPLADFAYLVMHWVLPPDGRSGLAGLDLPALGLPTLDEAVARYCQASGREGVPDLHWYFAYNLFRLTGILQGIKKRVLDGNASSPQAAVMAAKVGPYAEAAWAQARAAGAKE